nr:hypothetical protein [uncultured Allomuricauda sp.]
MAEKNEAQCQHLVEEWESRCTNYHKLVDDITRGFINNPLFITQR